MLRDLACPTCGAPGLEPNQPNGVVICKFCGNKFAEDDRIACPNCESINSLEAGFCARCGEKLKRSCPACGVENWAGAEFCISCGRDLDLLTYLTERQTRGFQATLEEQRQIAQTLKDEEEAGSQQRLGQMWESERRRQEFMKRQTAQQRREQSTMLVTVSVIAVLLIGLIVAALIFLLLTR
jgi:uncharacterized Zn finger protein (UPF0148 family)